MKYTNNCIHIFVLFKTGIKTSVRLYKMKKRINEIHLKQGWCGLASIARQGFPGSQTWVEFNLLKFLGLLPSFFPTFSGFKSCSENRN